MTPEQEMKVIVWAAGECWHQVSDDKRVFDDGFGAYQIRYCAFCGLPWNACLTGFDIDNPLPTDLNELFRLAEKLDDEYGLSLRKRNTTDGWKWMTWFQGTNKQSQAMYARSPADALRKALYAVAEQKVVTK
jgi:hypothetical protein